VIAWRLLPERHIHQQPVAFHIHDIAECAVAATAEVESHAALADAQVANVEVVEPVRQLRIDDVQFFTGALGWMPSTEERIRNIAPEAQACGEHDTG